MRTISSKLQIILIMMIFLIPLVGLLIGYNLYNVNTLNERVAQNSESTVLLYQRTVERDLKDIESYMANFLANDSESTQLRYPVSNLKAHVLGVEILRKYQSLIDTRQPIAGMFFYSRQNALFRAAYYPRNYSFTEKEETRRFLEDTIQNDPDCLKRGWFLHAVGERPFLFRILGSNGTYSMCAVDLDYVEFPQDFTEQEGDSFLFFTGPDGAPLTKKARLEREEIVPDSLEKDYAITGLPQNRYFVVHNEIPYAGVNLLYASPYRGLLMNMDNLQITILAASVIILLLIFFSFWFLKRFYLRPLDSLVKTMEQVRSGQLDAKLKADYQTDEFYRLGHTFNAMMDEIQALKIASYEQKLEIQQAELQYLKIQIRPHFFLNCLKNLYALAEEKKYEKVQGMILRLSEHLRLYLQDDRTLVPLEMEIRNVENYISLQQMCMPAPPSCSIQVDERLNGLRLPPLSLLTFVENSVKHGLAPGRTLEIHIRITLLEGGEETYVSLSVRDNGEGFSPEMLELLGGGEIKAQHHIGIQNVCRRFRLIYGDRSTFLFSNRGGAETEIFFPYSAEWKEAGRGTEQGKGGKPE